MNPDNIARRPLVGVGVLILNKNQLLVGRRRGEPSPGYYGLPGGHLECGERFEDCARREVMEETGLMVSSMESIGMINLYSNDMHYVDFNFLAKYQEGNPIVRESDRVEGWEWHDIYHLPSPLFQPSEAAIKFYLTRRTTRRFLSFLRKMLRITEDPFRLDGTAPREYKLLF
jgi:8-oxo-dGTP diphosphatase